jgi:threonine synthase
MRFFCLACHSEFDENIPRWRCDCGGILQIETENFFTKSMLSTREKSLWRYREALPLVDKKNIVSFQEGFTPLVKWRKDIFLKLDFLFPTGSFKDRGATVLISKLKEWKIKRFIEDSSGNAGCALAAYAAKANISATIIVPGNCSKKKVSQLKQYGAEVLFCKTRSECSKQALELSNQHFYASHVWSPHFYHGTKTIAFEIWEQTKGKLPAFIFAPVGNGTLFLGLAIGFMELFQFGLIQTLPILIGVQAENCSPLIPDKTFSKKDTIAEGIAIENPLRKAEILEMVNKCQGKIITVSEQEIKNAQNHLAKNGLYIEPTAAVGFAGFQKSDFAKNESSIIILTGSGLKS